MYFFVTITKKFMFLNNLFSFLQFFLRNDLNEEYLRINLTLRGNPRNGTIAQMHT